MERDFDNGKLDAIRNPEGYFILHQVKYTFDTKNLSIELHERENKSC